MDALDPIEIVNGTFASIPIPKAPTVGTVQIGNESPYPLKVEWPGHSIWILAGGVGTLDVSKYSFGGNVKLTPEVISSSSNPPSTVVMVNLYAPGEPVMDLTAFVRLNNIGNGSLPVSSTTQLINNGAPDGTIIVETTPASQATSAFSLDNSGNLILRTLSSSVWAVILEILSGGAGAATAIFHGSADLAAQALSVAASDVTAGSLNIGVGSFSSDNGAFFTVGNGFLTALAVLATGTHNNGVGNYAFASSAGAVYFDAGQFRSTGAGAVFLKMINFITGTNTLNSISFFSGTGNGTFSHGLGITPQWVGITDSASGSSQTVGVASYGSTTCVVTTGSGHAWKGIAVG